MISYEGLEKARAERAAKDAAKETAKEAKKAERETKKAEKEAKKAAKEVEKATAGKEKLRRSKITQRKSPGKAGTPEPKAKLARMSEAQAEVEIAPEPWRAQWRGCGSGGYGRRDCRTTDRAKIGLRQARVGSAPCHCLII